MNRFLFYFFFLPKSRNPLFSFNRGVYPLSTYQTIPFILDHDAPSLDNLLPGLTNPSININKSQKTKYHALCVLSGNFSCLLWQALFKMFQQELHWPPSIAYPYLRQQTENLLKYPESALTGTLVRNDHITVKNHLAALSGSSLQALYQSFLDFYRQIRKSSKLHDLIFTRKN